MTPDQEMSAALRRCAGHVAALQADFREERRQMEVMIGMLAELLGDSLVSSLPEVEGTMDLAARSSRSTE